LGIVNQAQQRERRNGQTHPIHRNSLHPTFLGHHQRLTLTNPLKIALAAIATSRRNAQNEDGAGVVPPRRRFSEKTGS
jgi:hypothetical protein